MDLIAAASGIMEGTIAEAMVRMKVAEKTLSRSNGRNKSVISQRAVTQNPGRPCTYQADGVRITFAESSESFGQIADMY